MEWLKNIALPQSSDHIELLGYMFVIVLVLFITFSSIIFWGTLLSVYFKKKESQRLDVKYRHLSKDIIELVLVNKTTGIMFCVVPLITMILIFAQLFQAMDNPNLLYLTISLVLLFISLLFIYDYKNSFDEFRQINLNSGISGLVTLFIAMWMFSAGLTASVFNELWQSDSLTAHLFSSAVLIRFLFLILVSLAVTGAVLLYGIFNLKVVNRETDEEYERLVKNVSLRTTFTATVFIPVFMLINLIMIPNTSLSGAVFVYLLLGIVFIFIAYHLLYLLYKKLNKAITAYLLVTLMCFVLTYVINDQMIIAGSNKVHYAKLTAEFDEYLTNLRGEVKTDEMNAQEIYKVRCSSCHAFDRKLVGPPHDEVVPKYFGKENQLVAYLRNPVRVNPEYPPMPNPGLKPVEAKAIAEYILAKVKERSGN